MLMDYQTLLTLVLLLVFLNTLNNLRILQQPLPPSGWTDVPLVSVLVPARNEERNIARCLRSLLAQDYPRLEVLVLDDASEDETARIVKELACQDDRLRLLQGQPLPPNWHGKAYACYQLARAARGHWLLFTDADTEHAPQAVSATVYMAQQEGADLLSVFPELIAGSWGERLMLPIIPFALLAGLPLAFVHRRRAPRAAVALGPFMLFSRRGYWRCGGHAAVRANIVDDLGLAEEVKVAGGRLVLADGSHLVRARMYHGLRELWYGISKSAFAALHYSWWALTAALLSSSALFLGPFLFLFLGWWRGYVGPAWQELPLMQIALIWAASLAIARRFRMSYGMALLRPLTIAVTALILLHSAWSARWGQGNEWKGRYYRPEVLASAGGLSGEDVS